MKNFLKVAAFGAMLAASTTLAHADTIQFGGNYFSNVGGVTSTQFGAGTNSYTVNATGVISNSGPTPGATFGTVNTGPTAVANPFTFTFGSALGGVGLFTFGETSTSANGIEFYANSVTRITGSEILIQGYLVGGTFGASTLASYDLSALAPQGGAAGTYIANLAVPPVGSAPEPSSLVLLGTGMVSAAGMMFRRRRSIA